MPSHVATETVQSKLRDVLRADAYRYSGVIGRRSFFSTYFRYPGFRFTYHLRKVAYYSSRKRTIGLIPYLFHRVWLHHYRFRYGFDISAHTVIGAGLYIGHFGGVVISPEAVLGCNVNIAHGVTIGATSRGERRGAPTLGDRVWVGTGAVIVGKVKIEDDALIAPAAYVNFDVPAHAVVMGNPARVVSQKGSAGYINHVLAEPLRSAE